MTEKGILMDPVLKNMEVLVLHCGPDAAAEHVLHLAESSADPPHCFGEATLTLRRDLAV